MNNLRLQKSYRRLKKNLLILLLVHIIVSIALRFSPRQDFFPFFSWSLFTFVPSAETDFEILVKSVDGVTLEDPVFLDKMVHFKEKGLPGPKKLLKKLRYAHGKKNWERFEKILGSLEKIYFSDFSRVEYEVVQIKFNPLKRLKFGKIDQTKLIRSSVVENSKRDEISTASEGA